MAARPLLQLLCQMIEAKGGDDYIFEQLASNVPTRLIIEEFINPKTGKSFNRGMLYYWKKMNPERNAGWKEARKLAAHSLMDDAADDLEEAEAQFMTPAQVSLLKEKTSFRQYLAERYNREEYGKPNEEMNVKLDLGGAFLQVLRQHGNAHTLEAPAIPEAEYEIEDNPIADLLT